MPDIVGIDWSKVWTGDDMSLVLTATQRAWLLQFASNLYVAPKLFLTPFESTDEEQINDDIQLLQAALLNATIPPKEDMNNLVDVKPVECSVSSGNALAWVSARGAWEQPTPAVGNKIIKGVNFNKGVWDFALHADKGSGYGKVSVIIRASGGSVIDTTLLDCYNSTSQIRQVFGGQFTITTQGAYFVEFLNETKNASSSGQLLTIHNLFMLKQ